VNVLPYDRSDAPVTESAPDGAAGFGAWVRPHWPVMAGLARRLSASAEWEDVLQEALTASWRKRSQFNPARGSLRSWLLAIVADQAAKSRRRLRPVSDAHADGPIADRESALALDLDRAVRALAPRQQVAVALYYYLGLPVAETAVVMGCSEGTVKATLSTARGRLRELLGEDYR
jgi:RNA polymerase sigma-70 factor (ECF subfamily)